MNNEKKYESGLIAKIYKLFMGTIKVVGLFFIFLSIGLYVYLCFNKSDLNYYITITASTIGFGLVTLYFSLINHKKMKDEKNNKNRLSTSDAIARFFDLSKNKVYIDVFVVVNIFLDSLQIDSLLNYDCDDNKYEEYLLHNIDKDKVEEALNNDILNKNDFLYGIAAMISEIEWLSYKFLNDDIDKSTFKNMMYKYIKDVYEIVLLLDAFRYIDNENYYISDAIKKCAEMEWYYDKKS